MVFYNEFFWGKCGERSKTHNIPVIGNICLFGCGRTAIFGDIAIGDEVVVGADEVVLKSVESYCAVAGVSAKRGIKMEDLI